VDQVGVASSPWATNMGLWKMADVSGLSYSSLLTTARNFLRAETLHATNDAVSNAWIDDTRYALHLYITMQSDQVWKSHHFVSEYRCLLRNELSTVLQSTGFREVRWLMPAESGFYQPLVLARRA
jgi:hypothetical protein